MTMENELRWPLAKVSFVKFINTAIYGLQIQLGVDQFAAVDGKRVFLPWRWPKGSKAADAKLQLKPYGSQGVELSTDFQLRVIMINEYQSCVYMPTTEDTVNNTCGFAGFLNNDATDDFRLPNGKVVDDPIVFGDSWVISQYSSEGAVCLLGSDQEQGNCDAQVNAEARQLCQVISNSTGPFKDCQGLTDLVAKSVHDCQYDLCAHNLDNELYCSSLENFVTQCQSQLVSNGSQIIWRSDSLCPKPCNGSHQHYEACGTSCPATCEDPRAPQSCIQPCHDGCVCDVGYVLSGGQCVNLTECGCTDADGNYYPSGLEWVDENCAFTHTCRNGQISSTSTKCGANASCKVSSRKFSHE